MTMANSLQMRKLLNEKQLDDSFSVVYKKESYNTQYGRFLNVLDSFCELFDKDNERDVTLFSAPGRS